MNALAGFMKFIGRVHKQGDPVFHLLVAGKGRFLIPGELIPSAFNEEGFEISKVAANSLQRKADEVVAWVKDNPEVDEGTVSKLIASKVQDFVIEFSWYSEIFVNGRHISHEELAEASLADLIHLVVKEEISIQKAA